MSEELQESQPQVSKLQELLNQASGYKEANKVEDTNKETKVDSEESDQSDVDEKKSDLVEKNLDKEDFESKYNEISQKTSDLDKKLSEARSWGHKQCIANKKAKKKITDFLETLQDEGVIEENDVDHILDDFGVPTDEDNIQEATSDNKYGELRNDLDKAFEYVKKCSGIEKSEEKYTAYFKYFHMLTPKEQESDLEYISDLPISDAINYVMDLGSQLYHKVDAGAVKHGGVLPYVSFLQEKIQTLEKRNKELEAGIDDESPRVYATSNTSRSTGSGKVKKKEFADYFRSSRI